ncbi:MAG: diadenylate cyclase CdaA [Candidatus Omnitrophica bacterium]|nr:diadenylate cyclase CdaA [Candidatus Omnitrophota bacterium]
MNLPHFLNWKAILEIFILWIAIYSILYFLKGTKAVYLLRGIFVLVIALLVFQLLGLPVLTRLLTYFFAFFLILIAIIFQPELRDGLAKLGKRHFFIFEPKIEEIEFMLNEIISAVKIFSKEKIGALIAIKRQIGLRNIIESGIILNADLSCQLLNTLFYPNSPLHDGGVIIENRKIIAAGCLFPLTEKRLNGFLGMRHRAGIGLSEQSDALVIIVSEENGSISLAILGQLSQNLNCEELLTILKGQLTKKR